MRQSRNAVLWGEAMTYELDALQIAYTNLGAMAVHLNEPASCGNHLVAPAGRCATWCSTFSGRCAALQPTVQRRMSDRYRARQRQIRVSRESSRLTGELRLLLLGNPRPDDQPAAANETGRSQSGWASDWSTLLGPHAHVVAIRAVTVQPHEHEHVNVR